jgi:hypothetical protein
LVCAQSVGIDTLSDAQIVAEQLTDNGAWEKRPSKKKSPLSLAIRHRNLRATATSIVITIPVSIAHVFIHLAAIRAELICAFCVPRTRKVAIISGPGHIQISLTSPVTDRSSRTGPIAVRAMSAIYATSMGSNSEEESSQG